MKKILAIVLLLSIISCCLCCCSSSKNNDSFNISKDELKIVRDKRSTKVVKLYGGEFLDDFAQGKDINTIISDNNHPTYMLISSNDEISYKRIDNDNVYELDDLSDWAPFVRYVETPKIYFWEGVKIYNAYLLNGEESDDGVYLYLVTNDGDYVLYKEFMAYKEMYLFPIDEFYEFAHAVYEGRAAMSESEEIIPASSFFDMEPYRYYEFMYMLDG